MITRLQLQTLLFKEREQYIRDYGRLVEARTEDRYSSYLYSMGYFYAELVYDNAAGRIEDIVLKQTFHSNL